MRPAPADEDATNASADSGARTNDEELNQFTDHAAEHAPNHQDRPDSVLGKTRSAEVASRRVALVFTAPRKAPLPGAVPGAAAPTGNLVIASGHASRNDLPAGEQHVPLDPRAAHLSSG